MNEIWWWDLVVGIVAPCLREWDQWKGTSFNWYEKKVIALMENEMWVPNIEAWFAASRADFDNIRSVVEMFNNMEKQPIIASLWRATEYDTKCSLEALEWYKKPRVHILMATSDEHVNAKFTKKWKDLEERRKWVKLQIETEVQRVIKHYENTGIKVEIEFSPEDATWSALILNEDDWKKYPDLNSDQFNFLVECIELAIKNWANIINAPDTLWNLLPHQTERFFKELVKRTNYLKEKYNFKFSSHVHNDSASATQNSIFAIRWWATDIETTIAWLWERTWNAPIHEIIWIIQTLWHSILDDWRKVVLADDFQTQLIWPITRFVSRIVALDKSLQNPFIWAYSNVDGAWIHTATPWVYWETKDKEQFWWENKEPSFSPRSWSTEISSMLEQYWIEEDKWSEIIQRVTQVACEKAEKVKGLYWANLYAIYLKEKWDFSINDINISWKNVTVKITLFWEEVTISWSWEWKNGVIDWLITWINEFLWEEVINVESIKVVNKPSLRSEIEKFYEEVDETTVKLSQEYKEQVEKILNTIPLNWTESKQLWVSHVNLKVWNENFSSVWSSYAVTESNVEAIIEWALFIIVEKVKNK